MRSTSLRRRKSGSDFSNAEKAVGDVFDEALATDRFFEESVNGEQERQANANLLYPVKSMDPGASGFTYRSSSDG